MSRRHLPKGLGHRRREVTVIEAVGLGDERVVVEDGPWGGPATVTPWAAEPEPKPVPGLGKPVPALNREQRRALKRAGRRKGGQR